MLRIFKKRTCDDAYQSGRNFVNKHIAKEGESKEVIDNLFALAKGSFNHNKFHDAFDKGAIDRLKELGYESPY